MSDKRHIRQNGTFSVSSNKSVHGELRIDGPRTVLSLHARGADRFSHSYFDELIPANGCVHGILNDTSRVSLLECIRLRSTAGGIGDDAFTSAEIFPNYVLQGNRHLGPTERLISGVELVLEDASTLFYDFDAFGHLHDARPFIEQITQAQSTFIASMRPGASPIETGSNPLIFYYTGKYEIFTSDTSIGRVSAHHRPTYTLGGPSGVGVTNVIPLRIDYREPTFFKRMMRDVAALLRFFDTVAGRRQEIPEFIIDLQNEDGGSSRLQVHWSHAPNRGGAEDDDRKPNPGDILLNAVDDPAAFSTVLANWIGHDNLRREARQRFSNCFAQRSTYSHDRLIGAANMFDILPPDAVPQDVELSPELREAKEAGQRIFERLSQSIERDSVLGALGRLGKSSLKRKIRSRAERIIGAQGDRFPDLFLVTDEAVNCRNHFVHGSRASFDYTEHFDVVCFFTDALEFVFAASDLIDSGWDVYAWTRHGTTMSHPFGGFIVSYTGGVRRLKEVLQLSRNAGTKS
jgi:ApeA N-terminal domain 1